jgi:hypothetical protein
MSTRKQLIFYDTEFMDIDKITVLFLFFMAILKHDMVTTKYTQTILV